MRRSAFEEVFFLSARETRLPNPDVDLFLPLSLIAGESVSIQMLDGNETILRGPATITMVSQHTFPPVPMPVQVSSHLLLLLFGCA
jgi:hypothetical protein